MKALNIKVQPWVGAFVLAFVAGVVLAQGAPVIITRASSGGSSGGDSCTGASCNIGPGGIVTDGGVVAQSFTATAASGSDAFKVANNGARTHFGTGAGDFITSDGTNLVASTTFTAIGGIIASGASGSVTASINQGFLLGSDFVLLDGTAAALTAGQRYLRGAVADGAAAVTFTTCNLNPLTTAGAHIQDWKAGSLASATVSYVGKDGEFVSTGGTSSLGNGCLTVGGSAISLACSTTTATNQSIGLGANGQFSLGSGTSRFNVFGLAISATAPTITGFGGTGAAVSASNGTAALDINVGTVAPGNTGTITFPTATTGWVCNCYNFTTTTAVNKIIVTGGSATTCAIAQVVATTNIAANFAASDHIRCTATGL